ncbi:MAG: restriction endonuclease [Staphylococcus equorum]|uniref:restriction endonuclease FokI C-terminal domain-containing protein n=1 Tax=Acinetobacter guillouiae TaxID=106649 RepID=UPI00264DC935|nr:restriction endonuclease [Staphylococcus equorum]
MLNQDVVEKIHDLWNQYINDDKLILNAQGKELNNIDELRKIAIKQLNVIISKFINNEVGVSEFKTSIDSFNKKNNLWGFTAIKGQFFFNQLIKNLNDNDLNYITELLKKCISEPTDLKDALNKIYKLEKYCLENYKKANDKRLVANPKSICYFLSYFWQISDNEKWPIYFTASVQALEELNIWVEQDTQFKNYDFFFKLNEDIRNVLTEHTNHKINNWDIEHILWNFKGNPNKKNDKKKEYSVNTLQKSAIIENSNNLLNSSFKLSDYIIPKVSKLIELGNSNDFSPSKKGVEFEKIVQEIFEQLDFEVEYLGQGKGRNPDAIIKCRLENTAFIVDAKAYNSGYSLGTDDRAIKEYINHYCPILKKDGYQKIGFIIISNEYKSNFDNFINEITWSTDIKRFILLTSEALLYLLAFKTKDKINIQNIIETLVSLSNPITTEQIINKFDDV